MSNGAVGRIRSLDSLRGIAALIVVFCHLMFLLPGSYENFKAGAPFSLGNPWSWIFATPLRMFVNGPGSVFVFFVLSGLVLALTFVGRDDQRYTPFLIKRIMRLWPPFAVAICVSAALQAMVIGPGAGHPNIGIFDSWNVPVSWAVIARHLDLTQLFVSPIIELDTPMWSLVHELRISIIFPLIVICAFRRPAISFAGAVALLFASALIVGRHTERVTGLAMTGLYAWLFFAGAIMASNIAVLRMKVSALPSSAKIVILITALYFLAFAQRDTIGFFSRVSCVLAGGSAAIVITALCTTESPITRLLETPIPSWLGKISYSLYLIHKPVLQAVFHSFPQMPYLFNAALSLALALLGAEILHRVAEVPSMEAGRMLAGRIAAKRQEPLPAGGIAP